MAERRSRSPTQPNAEASGSGSGPSTRYQMNPGTTRQRSVSPPLPTNTTSSSPAKSPRRTTQREAPPANRSGVDTDSPNWAPTSPDLPNWLTPRPPSAAETTTDADSRPRQRQRLDSPSAPPPVVPTNEAPAPRQAQHPAGFIFRIPTRRPAPAPGPPSTGPNDAGAERIPSNPPDGGHQEVSDPPFITWTFQVRGGEHTQPQAHALPHPRLPYVGILPVGPRPPRNPSATDTNTETETITRPPANDHTFLPFPSGSGPMGMGMGMRMGPFGPVSIPPSEMPQFIPIPRTRPAFPDPREMIPPFFGAAGIPGPSNGAPGAGGGEGEGQHEIMFFPIGYTFFPVSGPTHPGPAKAAELVKVLSNVDIETMEALDLKIRTEEKGQNQDELGWKCGICLQGLEDEDKPVAAKAQTEVEVGKPEVMNNDEGITDQTERKEATGVKTTPCNHLFHGECLQPWFERHLSCPLCRKSLESLLSAGSDEAGLD